MNVTLCNPAPDRLKTRFRPGGPRFVLITCWLAGAILLVVGCSSTRTFPETGFPDARTADYATNLLHEGDVVSINFQFSTNFNAVQKIPLDGTLNLETVGPVKAAGRTITDLQAELARLYKPLVKDDVVTVKLTASASSVWISGAVVRPGKIPMERPMTALEAIMEAGGFDPYRAKMSDVTVVRLKDGKQRTYRLNLKQVLQGEDPEPFYLKPFDIVHVPTKTFNF